MTINREYWAVYLRNMADEIEAGSDYYAIMLTHSAPVGGDPLIPMDAMPIGHSFLVSSLPLVDVDEEKIKAAIERRA